MDELQARHRKEQKELQSKIDSKKKNASKKTRKGVNDECDRLERELREKQEAEIAALAPSALEDAIQKLDLEDPNSAVNTNNGNEGEAKVAVKNSAHTRDAGKPEHVDDDARSKGKKPNRRKAQLARRAAEQEAQIAAATEEAADMPDKRQQELDAMKTQMRSRGLVETMIRPDGHCLYSACALTLSTGKAQHYKDVRIAAADFISMHSDDFAPFLEEPVDSYTHKIKDTAEWGGHLELQAIAKSFGTTINVLQATGHVEKIEPETESEKEIWLAYYKYNFGLGEHYNALKKTHAC